MFCGEKFYLIIYYLFALVTTPLSHREGSGVGLLISDSVL